MVNLILTHTAMVTGNYMLNDNHTLSDTDTGYCNHELIYTIT